MIVGGAGGPREATGRPPAIDLVLHHHSGGSGGTGRRRVRNRQDEDEEHGVVWRGVFRAPPGGRRNQQAFGNGRSELELMLAEYGTCLCIGRGAIGGCAVAVHSRSTKTRDATRRTHFETVNELRIITWTITHHASWPWT